MTQPMPKAMVLAAGLGTRMRPLTEHLPKPLIKVAGVSLIDRALNWLAASGVQEVVVNSHYLAELLETHLAKRHAPKLYISHEPVVLETGGGVKQALPLLGTNNSLPPRGGGLGRGGSINVIADGVGGEFPPSPPSLTRGEGEGKNGDAPFFVVNSDVICLDGTVPALHRLQQAWDDSMDVLLLVHPLTDAVGFDGPGDFFVEGNTLRRRLHAPSAPFVFTGVQMLHPRLFQGAPDGAFSLNALYNRGMQKDGTLARVKGLAHDGHWLHVGDPNGLKLAENWLNAH